MDGEDSAETMVYNTKGKPKEKKKKKREKRKRKVEEIQQ